MTTMKCFGGIAIALLVGCGGGGTPGDGGDASDVGTADASDVVVQNDTGNNDVAPVDVVGSDASDGGASCQIRHALVATSDFATMGGFVVGDIATKMFSEIDPTTSIDQDHIVRAGACLVFDLQRTVGAVRVIDPANPTTALRTIMIPGVPGNDGGTVSSDPTDLVVVSPTKAYVAAYNSAQIVIINPTAGTVTGMIDGSAFADADGIPEFGWLVAAGGKVYAGAQQLDRPNFYTAPAHSHIAVIDSATDALIDQDSSMAGVQGIELSYGDPVSATVTDDGMSLLVAGGGFGSPTAGGVDVIDLASGTVVRSITATALGATPSAVVDAMGAFAWVGAELPMGDAGATTHAIVQFDYMTGMVRSAPIASPTFPVSDMRRSPEGAIWVIGTAYDMSFTPTGYADVYGSNGVELNVAPFTTAGHLAMTSIDFTP